MVSCLIFPPDSAVLVVSLFLRAHSWPGQRRFHSVFFFTVSFLRVCTRLTVAAAFGPS